MKYRTVLLFGAPGSGKGTQGKVLGTIPGLFHFACGDAFRNLRITDPLGKLFIEYSSKGQLVPDEPTIDPGGATSKPAGCIRCSIPRTTYWCLTAFPGTRQAEILDDIFDVKAVFHLPPGDDEDGRALQRVPAREPP
jgi:adenylate kinase